MRAPEHPKVSRSPSILCFHLNLPESELLREWAQEVHDLPCTTDVPWMPYQEVNSEGKRVLCRIENFANSHVGLDSFLRGQRATSLL
ncbi:hypothetical protein N7449_007072 [Penicillium cf. viridicatum]|uniref:Uncharacterized protein n=1 Tax=Penicillium cf. viridicatum TaxID=2972119 RepID=A0A9W9JGR9_9EURO|nr:hypothetical protein N7449_007072 [Penicillium cf. viridicatum]